MDVLTFPGFEYKSGLFAFYIIILSNYFHDILSCDLQRFMISKDSIVARHIIIFMTAFFAITLTEYGKDDNDSDTSLLNYFLTTITVYVIFVFSSKAKAEYVFPMLIILMLDQILKLYTNIIEKKSKVAESDKKVQIDQIARVRNILTYLIIGIIVLGTFVYFFRQNTEFGKNFSIVTFFLGTFKCKGVLVT
jgi:hypothetical protein